MNKRNIPVNTIRNIGKVRGEKLNKLGIFTLEDLIMHFPRGYQNRARRVMLSTLRQELTEECPETAVPVSTVLEVVSAPSVYTIRPKMTVLRFRASDGTDTCTVSFFNQTYLKGTFTKGTTYRFWGKVKKTNGVLNMSVPVFELYSDSLRPIVPVYRTTAGISQKILSGIISRLLESDDNLPADIIPESVLSKYGMMDYRSAIRKIHSPGNESDISQAKERLAFDEMAVRALSIYTVNSSLRTKAALEISNDDMSGFTGRLPFSLTGAQSRALDEIIHDIKDKNIMNRILSGDVGSGKTVVAAAAIYLCALNKGDCFLIAPTEILANQHFRYLTETFSGTGISVRLMTGSTGKKDRKETESLLKIPAGSRQFGTVIVGTHAMLYSCGRSELPGVAVIDEQHRFGVGQRVALLEKQNGINLLSMSATPIPRTMSLISMGILDVSHIDELPAGRQKIESYTVNSTYRERLRHFIGEQVRAGHQVYVVCPAIEQKNTNEMTAEDEFDIPFGSGQDDYPADTAGIRTAADVSVELQHELNGVTVGLMHGKMKNDDKDDVMRRFSSGEIDVLVSTTVVEVGVNVPNASLMIVENADRFGLSQLHQLRGRVGRGSAKSYFIMISDSKTETSVERLRVISENDNGYTIAEKDLRQRGPGDFLQSTGEFRQHGENADDLIDDCCSDKVKNDVADFIGHIIKSDPGLKDPEYRELYEIVYEKVDGMTYYSN